MERENFNGIKTPLLDIPFKQLEEKEEKEGFCILPSGALVELGVKVRDNHINSMNIKLPEEVMVVSSFVNPKIGLVSFRLTDSEILKLEENQKKWKDEILEEDEIPEEYCDDPEAESVDSSLYIENNEEYKKESISFSNEIKTKQREVDLKFLEKIGVKLEKPKDFESLDLSVVAKIENKDLGSK